MLLVCEGGLVVVCEETFFSRWTRLRIFLRTRVTIHKTIILYQDSSNDQIICHEGVWGYSYTNINAVSQHLLIRRNVLFLNSLKGFRRSLGQRSHFYWLLFTFFALLAVLTQSKLPKNQLPTSFGLRYDDHLWSSVIDLLNLSDPTTINSQHRHDKIILSRTQKDKTVLSPGQDFVPGQNSFVSGTRFCPQDKLEYTWLGFVGWIKFCHWFWGSYWFLWRNTVWIRPLNVGCRNFFPLS